MYNVHFSRLHLEKEHVTHFVGIFSGVRDCVFCRDIKGISELSLKQLTLPYKISYIRVSLEIPLLSLVFCAL